MLHAGLSQSRDFYRPTDHVVLGRVIAKRRLDTGAHPLDLVPGGLADSLALVAYFRQLGFQVGERVVETADLGNVHGQRGHIDAAIGQALIDPVPGLLGVYSLREDIAGELFCRHIILLPYCLSDFEVYRQGIKLHSERIKLPGN